MTDGARLAGLVLTKPNVKSVITGNYIDNTFIEWTNEHDAEPDFSQRVLVRRAVVHRQHLYRQ